MKKQSLLINPFQRIAGVQALLWGTLGIAFTTTACYFAQFHFIGILKAGILSAPTGFFTLLLNQLIICLLPVILFYIAGLFLSSSKIRFIDVLGTFSFAQLPFLFIPLVGFSPSVRQVLSVEFLHQLLKNPAIFQEINFQLAFCFLLGTILFLVWSIIWLFQAYKTSCNLKGAKLGWSFAILLILSDILCRIFINQLLKF
jgi:hypothetical protein